MEPVGVAVSLVSLAALFEAAVHCFQYVQLGKNFGSDFQTSYLQLDNAQLRLSRWGRALGLSADAGEVASLTKSYPPEDVQQAEAVLGHIINLFRQAEEVSRRFQHDRSDGGHAGVSDFQDVFTASTLPLHQRMRDICRRRQKNTSAGKKAKWALYEKEHLDRLIGDLRTLLDDLVGLFPSAKEAQDRLCDQEAAQLRDEAALPTLRDIAAQQDKPLEDAFARLSAQGSRETKNTWNNKDNTKVGNQGDTITVYGSQSVSF